MYISNPAAWAGVGLWGRIPDVVTALPIPSKNRGGQNVNNDYN